MSSIKIVHHVNRQQRYEELWNKRSKHKKQYLVYKKHADTKRWKKWTLKSTATLYKPAAKK